MSKQLANNISSVLNGKLALIAPSYVMRIEDDLKLFAALSGTDEKDHQAEARNTMMAAYGFSAYDAEKPFAYADGIAFIPVTGLLLNRYSYSWSGMTGYNAIRAQLQYAMEDSDVKGIVFDINSGGGQVSGCFELATEIREARSVKPSVAMVDAYAFSAAYAIASAASKIVLTPSGEVGSIGALIAHFDYSKMMDEYGVKVSLIHSGSHKVDGNPYEKLSREDIAGFQAKVDTARKNFVDLVALNRGLETQVVYDTEAATYNADEALALGLVDAVEPPSEAIQAFFNELSGSQSNQEFYMSTKPEVTQASAAAAQNEANAPAPAAQNEQTATTTTATTAEATAQAVTAERQRISGILACDEASNRHALANHLALNTQLSVDEAKAVLAVAPQEAAASPASDTNALADAMAATGGGAGVKADEAEASGTTMTRAQEILAAHTQAVGA